MKTLFNTNESSSGESIEIKIRRMTANKEPIKAEITPIYTERQDGVLPQFDPRTDKWDIAMNISNDVAEASRQLRDTAPNIPTNTEEE